MHLARCSLSLAILAAVWGCRPDPSLSLPLAPLDWESADTHCVLHIHPTETPHGGELIELGRGMYHAELVHDERQHLIEIYLLDGQVAQSVPVAASAIRINVLVDNKPSQFRLKAEPLADEPPGLSSHFQIRDKTLSDTLSRPNSKLLLNVMIHGKQFVEEIKNDTPGQNRVAHHHAPPGR